MQYLQDTESYSFLIESCLAYFQFTQSWFSREGYNLRDVDIIFIIPYLLTAICTVSTQYVFFILFFFEPTQHWSVAF